MKHNAHVMNANYWQELYEKTGRTMHESDWRYFGAKHHTIGQFWHKEIGGCWKRDSQNFFSSLSKSILNDLK